MVTLSVANVSLAAAWSILCVVFTCAYVHGKEFAANKESATAWGGVIGLAAFFAWLAVEDDESECDEGGSSDADDGHAGGDKKHRD